jgi:hypothetical protein
MEIYCHVSIHQDVVGCKRLLNNHCRLLNKIGVTFEASTTEEIHTVVFLAYDAVYFGRCLLTLRGKDT